MLLLSELCKGELKYIKIRIRMTLLIPCVILPSNSASPYCFFPTYHTDISKHQAKLSITYNQLKCLIAGAGFPILKCIFSYVFSFAIMLSLFYLLKPISISCSVPWINQSTQVLLIQSHQPAPPSSSLFFFMCAYTYIYSTISLVVKHTDQ